MKFNEELKLKLGTVHDVMNELINLELISPIEMILIKNEPKNNIDPNVIMDLRHSKSRNIHTSYNYLATTETKPSIKGSEPQSSDDEIYTTQREILKFKTKLEIERKKRFILDHKKLNASVQFHQSKGFLNKQSKRKQLEMHPTFEVNSKPKNSLTVNERSDDKNLVPFSLINDEQGSSMYPLKELDSENTQIEINQETFKFSMINHICNFTVSQTSQENSHFIAIFSKENEISYNSKELCLASDKINSVNHSSDMSDSPLNFDNKICSNMSTEIMHTDNKLKADSPVLKNVEYETLHLYWNIWKEKIKQKKHSFETARYAAYSDSSNKVTQKRKILHFYWNEWKTLVELKKEIKFQDERKSKREKKLKHFILKLEQQLKNKNKEIKIENELTQELDRGTNNINQNTFCKHMGRVTHGRFNLQGKIIEKQRKCLEEQKKVIEKMKLEQLKLQNDLIDKNTNKNIKIQIQNGNCEAQGLLKGLSLHMRAEIVRPVPEIIKRMNEREEERKRRWDMWRAKMRQKELEQQKQLQIQEEMKLEKAEIEKKKKSYEKREKIRLEKLLKEQKERERKEHESMITIAQNLYRRSLLSQCFLKLRKYAVHIQIKSICMNEFYENKLQEKMFCQWLKNKQESIKQKLFAANSLYNKQIKWKYWGQWLRVHHNYKMKIQAAIDFYFLSLKCNAFKIWFDFNQTRQKTLECEILKAKEHYTRIILKKYLNSWRKLPSLMQEEREKEQRVRAWKDKVKEILPDFSIEYD